MKTWLLLAALALAGCGTVHNTVRDGADELAALGAARDGGHWRVLSLLAER